MFHITKSSKSPLAQTFHQFLIYLSKLYLSSLMKKLVFIILSLIISLPDSKAQDNTIYDKAIKSFKTEVNGDWSMPPVIMLASDDVLNISFDRLGHDYVDLNYSIRHCNWDWTESDMFEIDYMDGFNGNDIEDYAASINTTVEYTHYTLDIPNEYVSLKLSGNYILEIYDDDGNTVAETRFKVLDQKVTTGAQITSNTLIDNNKSHQQLNVIINNTGYDIRIPQNELKVVVVQNESPLDTVILTKPTFIGSNRIEYANTRDLIFKAGNEFRRFEMLNENDAMMGVSDIKYFAPYYHVTLDMDKRRSNYYYDEDQDGNYIIRNNNVYDSTTEADYMLVHFTLVSDRLDDSDVYIYGELTGNTANDECRMTYNAELGCYERTLMLKQGLYNYRYITGDSQGRLTHTRFEGDFYETENEYSIYVYHRAFGERYDKLIGFSHIFSR